MLTKLRLMMLLCLLCVPMLASAKAPLFFNTGDEIFPIKNGPTFDDGYKLGYACKRFGLFGADLWTWDCQMMAVNEEKFTAAELPAELKTQYAAKYNEGDRDRNVWNHYGFGLILLAILAYLGFKIFSKSEEQN